MNGKSKKANKIIKKCSNACEYKIIVYSKMSGTGANDCQELNGFTILAYWNPTKGKAFRVDNINIYINELLEC